MQLAEALAPDEVKALGRLVSTPDAKQAIEAKFQVVSLSAVIAAGGYTRADGEDQDPRELFMEWENRPTNRLGSRRVRSALVPKLAITPSRARDVTYTGIGKFLFFSTGKWEMGVPYRGKGDLPGGPRFTATAPIIPAEARAVSEQLKFSLVLWEADWKPVPVPLGDPAILVPLIGDLYAVAAVWDLTEMEKSVLRKAFV